jgi:hypothetical protein
VVPAPGQPTVLTTTAACGRPVAAAILVLALATVAPTAITAPVTLATAMTA